MPLHFLRSADTPLLEIFPAAASLYLLLPRAQAPPSAHLPASGRVLHTALHYSANRCPGSASQVLHLPFKLHARASWIPLSLASSSPARRRVSLRTRRRRVLRRAPWCFSARTFLFLALLPRAPSRSPVRPRSAQSLARPLLCRCCCARACRCFQLAVEPSSPPPSSALAQLCWPRPCSCSGSSAPPPHHCSPWRSPLVLAACS
ncbi:uncharacterized protein LOC100279439 [Zea mays]|uniref:Uncharacterized protein n=1 Tax=Zea mays TaxID=4577 RepID=B7ZY49_MAIZE|nr:uncharacterized protein LOC100279439 [Zea mays]ACL52848.1 unknown [Zea mays]|eukprot:NP_001145918.1 uncharacterized protein LOC100279439 [Zea mays]